MKETSVAPLTSLAADGTIITVPPSLQEELKEGDRLVCLGKENELVRIPLEERLRVKEAVDSAVEAFRNLQSVDDGAITSFFAYFADNLGNDEIWGEIQRANDQDVTRAQERGRSTTRLSVNEKMRRDMTAGLRVWENTSSLRGKVLNQIQHSGWRVEEIAAPLGVVGFIFEGRPNVFADATGVLRGGNTAVLRIGGDALGTAQAIMRHALIPALEKAALPQGSVALVESTARSAGYALFSDDRLSLAVARGSGRAVSLLGAMARQTGIPVSLHGTGGAWMYVAKDASPQRFEKAVYHSLDRKVCNTLNVCCIDKGRAKELVPTFFDTLERARQRRGKGYKVHIRAGDESYLEPRLLNQMTSVHRADGMKEELLVEPIRAEELGQEWEWEETPEVTLVIVDGAEEMISLFNHYSPHFVATVITESSAIKQRLFQELDAPFIGDGLTRWVDGQFALERPELGLSNWEGGRLFARSGFLSGESIFSIKVRATIEDEELHR